MAFSGDLNPKAPDKIIDQYFLLSPENALSKFRPATP